MKRTSCIKFWLVLNLNVKLWSLFFAILWFMHWCILVLDWGSLCLFTARHFPDIQLIVRLFSTFYMLNCPGTFSEKLIIQLELGLISLSCMLNMLIAFIYFKNSMTLWWCGLHIAMLSLFWELEIICFHVGFNVFIFYILFGDILPWFYFSW